MGRQDATRGAVQKKTPPSLPAVAGRASSGVVDLLLMSGDHARLCLRHATAMGRFPDKVCEVFE